MTKWQIVARFQRYCARCIRSHRENQKLTLEQLTEQFQMSPEWIRDIETQVRDINLLDVVVIAKYFQIESWQLVRDGGL
jgi:ribosome-binding protein aMBF1 (putative translation factor)